MAAFCDHILVVMFKILFFVLFVALGAAHPLPAQRQAAGSEVPAIVANGLEAYTAKGIEGAFQAWLAGSPVENDASMRASGIDALRTVERQYGRVVGHEILGVAPVGQTVRRVYVLLRYERGPLYAWFDCYETASGWIIPGFLMNTRPQVILTPEMLTPPRPSQN